MAKQMTRAERCGRARDVLTLRNQGLTFKDIAMRLGISPSIPPKNLDLICMGARLIRRGHPNSWPATRLSVCSQDIQDMALELCGREGRG